MNKLVKNELPISNTGSTEPIGLTKPTGGIEPTGTEPTGTELTGKSNGRIYGKITPKDDLLTKLVDSWESKSKKYSSIFNIEMSKKQINPEEKLPSDDLSRPIESICESNNTKISKKEIKPEGNFGAISEKIYGDYFDARKPERGCAPKDNYIEINGIPERQIYVDYLISKFAEASKIPKRYFDTIQPKVITKPVLTETIALSEPKPIVNSPTIKEINTKIDDIKDVLSNLSPSNVEYILKHIKTKYKPKVTSNDCMRY